MREMAMIRVERFTGSRRQLRSLFALADDSAAEIERYVGLGEVFVVRGQAEKVGDGQGPVLGHVQLVAERDAEDVLEIRSLAVSPAVQRKGVGTALVRFVIERARRAGCRKVAVATATADIGNLRFYQKLGFRMERIERDAFTVQRGYPRLEADGIEVRDRVWFSLELNR